MDNLKKIMLAVLEYHEHTLVLQDDFDEMDQIRMLQFCAKSHLTDSRLTQPSILDVVAFFLWLESNTCQLRANRSAAWHLLLDGE